MKQIYKKMLDNPQCTDDDRRIFREDCDKHKLWCGIRADLKRTIIKRILTKEYHLGKLFPELKKIEDGLTSDEQQLSFITLNFSDDLVRDQFKILPDFIGNKCQKSWIEYYMFSFEQRESDEISAKGTPKISDFRGFHVHILIKPKLLRKKKSEMIREFYSSFKQYLSDVQKIDVRQFPESQKFIRVNYILGNKCKSKLKKSVNDLKFRESEKLEQYYTNNSNYFLNDIINA